MSDDRYEIRSKIGQGGVGAVYRAFDRHLNREVAIKRVLPEGGYENQEEATKAMLNEAASLCSVQHPHIVTVFDAGVDNDGPYVVMELLSGRTIDEMIERGTLTFDDFREVAVQSQEALIAAQDLDLVHRDIKPTNVMVTWLPSGRFQVKIVDFGLAKFSPKPSLQTIDHGDSVFGSIHFMAPEQFERTPLDKRTDMYSMGCVYYYCLAGQYPFDGDTAPKVMNAHLQNSVTPIEQLRPDLPEWLSKWVMWHLARKMEDRPRDARESLKVFLMSEHGVTDEDQQDAAMAQPAPTPAPAGLVGTQTAPQPILPPEGQAPSIHTAAQSLKATASIPTPNPSANASAPPQMQTLGAPASSASGPAASGPKPNLVSGASTAAGVNFATPAAPPSPPSSSSGSSAPPTEVRLPNQNSGKLGNTGKGVIAALLAVAVAIGAVVVKGKQDEKADQRIRDEISVQFSDPSVTPEVVELDRERLAIILKDLSTPGKLDDNVRPTWLVALKNGKSLDTTDIDEVVAKFAAENTGMSEGVRQNLFEVLTSRAGRSAIPSLVSFVSNTSNSTSGRSALRAIQSMATEADFNSLLNIINQTSDPALRGSAVETLVKVVKDSDEPEAFEAPVVAAYNAATKPDIQTAYIRLAGATGGSKAAKIAQEALKASDPKMQVAGARALGNWPDESQFDTLIDFLSNSTGQIRSEGFAAAIDFLQKGPKLDEDDRAIQWESLNGVAVGQAEQLKIVGAMTRENGPWAVDILETFISNGNSDKVQAAAENAMDRVKENILKKERSSGQ